jgi:hypothetical protein
MWLFSFVVPSLYPVNYTTLSRSSRTSGIRNKNNIPPDPLLAKTSANSTQPKIDRKYYVYLLKNTCNNCTYVGSTVDLKRRLRQHNGDITGKVKQFTHFILRH